MKTGVQLITEELDRQISQKGWSPYHNDTHQKGEMLDAGLCYGYAAINVGHPSMGGPPPEWPWDSAWWKPSPERVGNLVKAGALIVAEIDRLQRETYRGGVVSAVNDSTGWALFDAAGDLIEQWPTHWPETVGARWLEQLGVKVSA